MKILWIDLNSSYAHSSLALPALHAQVKDNPEYQWDIVSATINENIGMVVDEIYRRQPDIMAATCWLFNHESLMHIVSRVKALLPKACVILGGPEFLGENEAFLRRNPFVDCVFRGEGEAEFPQWLKCWNEPEQWKTIFPNPQNGPARFLGTTYYVDFPHLRLIAIDTDGLHRMSDYTQVAFWLKQSLTNAKDKHTVVIMHHPVFSTAQGRQNPLIWLSFYGILREADVVFSGHDHNYARRTVEYKERFWVKQQPTLFIGTNASKKMYAVKEKVNYECSFSGEPVYEYVVVTKDTLSIHTYNLHSGELIDEVKVSQ